LKYPGKILAIVPITNIQKENIKQDFMIVRKNSNFIYDDIRNSLSKIR
jgi:hypothetical protein